MAWDVLMTALALALLTLLSAVAVAGTIDFEDGQVYGHVTNMDVPPKVICEGGNCFCASRRATVTGMRSQTRTQAAAGRR